jgi:hypothetical protein
VRAPAGRADQIRQLDESCDQRVDTVAGVGVPLVEHLDPGVVDYGNLMVGGTPVDASERGHDLLLGA